MNAHLKMMDESYSSTSKSLHSDPADIRFFSEAISYRVRDIRKLRSWLTHVASAEGHSLGELSVVICSDDYLLEINRSHLDHDYYTDIITFDYHSEPISGDLFISLDRVRENAKQRSLRTVDELHRVMVHGLLHLLGYTDKTDDEKRVMRQREDSYLTLRHFV